MADVPEDTHTKEKEYHETTSRCPHDYHVNNQFMSSRLSCEQPVDILRNIMKQPVDVLRTIM
ncbi:hypothetical protein J6590_059387 [Homalodisca vitripennis]|nr:hypothetical protein J6590_059387 [Homalodisca vitripennis]